MSAILWVLSLKGMSMHIDLPKNNFAFFKFIAGSLFLMAVISYNSIALYSFFIALAVGRAHSLGAWIAMWRSGKLNWKYITSMFLVSIAVSYWGLNMVPNLQILSFITSLLFCFHFFFDEFDLQEEERSWENILPSLSPAILISILLTKDYLHFNVPLNTFYVIAGGLLLIEIIHTKRIGWFFLHTKILTLFTLVAVALHMNAQGILATFLIFHYFFWFLYPIYKLHKYKPTERDSFVMILLLVVSTSLYFSITKNDYSDEVMQLTIRAFLIGTIIHVLATAPFGYLFGLPRKSPTTPVTP